MPLDSIAVLSILDRVTDANGNPVSGATLEFYEAGTSTPLTVYADADLTTALGSVVTCDAGGYPTSDGTAQVSIYTGTQSYKVIAKTSAGVIVTTRDNIKGAPDIPDTTSSALPETPVVTRTSTYTILSTDRAKLINADPTSGSFAVTLPSAVTVGDGWMIGVRHAGNTTNVVTVRTTGGQTIAAAGLSSATSHSLTGRGHTRWYKSDGVGYTVDAEVSPLMSGPLPFFRVADRLTAPPASPVGGARYIINGTPTGTWATLSFAENDVVESDGNGSWFKYTPVAGFFAYVVDEDLFTKFDGTSWEDQTGMSAPSSSTLKRAVIEHREVNGTAGGSSTANTWQNRTLNISVVSDITGLSLASSEITLPAGTYLISAMQHLYAEVGTLGGVTFAQQRINAVTAVLGESHLGVGSRIGGVATGAGVTFTATNSIELRDTFVVTVATGGTIALQYYVTTAQATNGLGYPSPETTVGFECYARVSIVSLSALQGPPGEQGVQGEGGLDASFPYQWSTATSGDPGSGKVRGNNATIASITEIGVSETDSAGGAMAAVLATWDDSNSAVRGIFRIAKEGAVGNFHVFHISGSGTDQGTYWTFPVTYVATSGTITNGTDCAVNFSFTGDKGDPGITVPSAGSLSTHTDFDETADFLYTIDTSAASATKKSASGDVRFTQLLLRDAGTAINSGGLVRVATSGSGVWLYQINTALAGDFSTATQALAIDSSGNVGIGTVSLLNKLTVSGGLTTVKTLSGSSSSDFNPANYISVTDTLDATGASNYGEHAIGLAVQHVMAAGVSKGNRHGILAILDKNASTGGGTTGTDDFYHALFGKLRLSAVGAIDGGTALSPYGNGYGGALGIFAESPASATYWNSLTGLEVDLEVPTNVNVREKMGVTAVLTNDDMVQGSVYDAAFGVHADGLAAHPGWKVAFSVGKPSSRWPLDTTVGTILGVDQAGTFSGSVQCKYGVDFNGVTFTDYAFRSNGFSVNGTGGMACSAALISYNGLALYDSDASHILTVRPGSNLSGNRTLTLTTGDSNQTIDIVSINGAWTSFTPTVTAGTGSYTTASGTVNYRIVGKTCNLRVTVTITTNGTAGTFTQVTLPVTANGTQVMVGREMAVTGFGMQGYVVSGTSNLIITRYDAAYAGGSGYVLSLSGTIEIT